MPDSTLEVWLPTVDAAIELAERYPEVYRAAIVQGLLTRVVGWEQEDKRSESLREVKPSPRGELNGDGFATVASELGVSEGALRRIVDVGPDRILRILARIDGASIAERANRYAATYCYLKEKLAGEIDTGIEELRILCQTHGCYNPANFTGYFRKGGQVLEIGQRGSSEKRYRLSNQGEQEARDVLRGLLA